MNSIPTLTEDQEEQRDSFVERLLAATAGVFDIFTIHIGNELGLYRALAGGDWLTSTELAGRTGTQERYIREWLEQQTVTGILVVEDAGAGPIDRRFRLPLAHAEVLVERDSLNYLAPLAQIAAGAVRPLPALLQAYRHGGGVPYGEYGRVFREGQAAINRAAFLQELGQEWLPAIPDIHARLSNGHQAKVADIGCGAGWSSIGIAQAYPSARVDGFDLDEPSIELARANAAEVAAEAKLNGRLTFQARDAADVAGDNNYDLVLALECIHDMSDPVRVLRTMHNLAGEDGSVIVADERVGDTFTANGNDVEWMMYGWSVLHCLPVGMADQPSVGTGTVMRVETLKEYAQAAGFSKVEVLSIENYFFRFYRLYV
jgi:SAM-dependent methyltransferase